MNKISCVRRQKETPTICLSRNQSIRSLAQDAQLPSFVSKSSSETTMKAKIIVTSPGKVEKLDSVRISRCTLNDFHRVTKIPNKIDASMESVDSERSISPLPKPSRLKSTEFPALDQISENSPSLVFQDTKLPKLCLKKIRWFDSHELELKQVNGKDVAQQIGRFSLHFHDHKPKIGSQLHRHMDKYQESVGLIKKCLENLDEIEILERGMMVKRIDCIKYNYSLDKEIQKFNTFESQLQISKDGQILMIINKRPVIQDVWVLEADPEAIVKAKLQNKIIELREMQERNEARDPHANVDHVRKEVENETKSMENNELHDIIRKLTKVVAQDRIKRQITIKMKVKFDQLDVLSKLPIRDEDGHEYMEYLSNTTTRFEDIQGFIFGPFSSRFWIYRKHFCTLEKTCSHRMPFYGWQCISLQTKDRDVDLVIRDQHKMNNFLSILIHKMETLDCSKGTALPLIKCLEAKKGIDMKQARHMIVKKTLLRFKILRIRLKISFMAFEKRMTIPELFMQAIMKTHDELLKESSIPLYDPFLPEKIETFDQLLNNDSSVGIRIIMKVNTIQVGKKGIKIDQELRQLVENNYAYDCQEKDCEKQIQSNIKAVFNKNNCQDIFKNAKLEGEYIIEPMLNRKRLQMKMSRAALMRHYHKINLVLRLKAIDKILMIRARLKIIEISKALFMLDIQQGHESFIPLELSQDYLPITFKYYDPILLIINEGLSEDRKEYFYSKNKINYKNYQDNNLKDIFYQKFFAGDKESKLTFKHQLINKKHSNEIDHTENENTMCLQKSRYIMIDDDVTKIKEKKIEQCHHRKFYKGFYTEADNEKVQLRFKFCHPREVTIKKQKHLVFKAQFLQKVHHMKMQGKKNELLRKTDRWLEQNIDKLIAKPKSKSVNTKLYDQKKFQQQLYQYAENKVLGKLMRKRVKDIKFQKHMVSPKVDYQIKNRNIETGVLETLRYFDDTQLFLSEEVRQTLHDLKKKIKKNEEQFRNESKYNMSRKDLIQKRSATQDLSQFNF